MINTILFIVVIFTSILAVIGVVLTLRTIWYLPKPPQETAPMTGHAIIVNGEPVAWFANHDELSAEWCAAAYRGEWVAWPADAPVLHVTRICSGSVIENSCSLA